MKLPRWFWVFAFLVCWPTLLFAETFSATNQNGKITRTAEPCQLGGWFKEWRSAKWFYQGKDYEACWTVQKNSEGGPLIVLVDSSGVVSSVPPAAFRKDDGI